MKKLDKSTFGAKVASLKQAVSVQGKIYHSIRVLNGKVQFIREDKTQSENIDLQELYKLFCNVSHPTTTVAKQFISGRVQSPAIAIINAISNPLGTKRPVSPIHIPTVISHSQKDIKRTKPSIGLKDETRFYIAFSSLVGEAYLKSKCISKPIGKEDLFLSNNFELYEFDEKIRRNFHVLLEQLQSDFSFNGDSLSHLVDGMVINHPQLGSCIVEFDEEQHFTPALKDVLKIQSKVIKNTFDQPYLKILNDTNYLYEVLKKHRIKYHFNQYPKTFVELVRVLQQEKASGYIESKNGFPYLGGRIAQRAYYDCLRNAAHLSPKNKETQPLLRFPKKYFEYESGVKFNKIDKSKLNELIKKYLIDVYNFKFRRKKLCVLDL